jgi:hypothetical protein
MLRNGSEGRGEVGGGGFAAEIWATDVKTDNIRNKKEQPPFARSRSISQQPNQVSD